MAKTITTSTTTTTISTLPSARAAAIAGVSAFGLLELGVFAGGIIGAVLVLAAAGSVLIPNKIHHASRSFNIMAVVAAVMAVLGMNAHGGLAVATSVVAGLAMTLAVVGPVQSIHRRSGM